MHSLHQYWILSIDVEVVICWFFSDLLRDQVVPILVFFTALIKLLRYYGILQVITRLMGGVLWFFMGTTLPEAFVAIADIFLGPVKY